MDSIGCPNLILVTIGMLVNSYIYLYACLTTGADKDRVIFLTASEDSDEKPKRKELQSPSIKLKEGDMTGPTADKKNLIFMRL